MTSGEFKELLPVNGRKFNLGELQQQIRGMIQFVPLGGRKWLIVDEEGKLKDLPINKEATELVIASGMNDVIVGDVILANHEECMDEGEPIPTEEGQEAPIMPEVDVIDSNPGLQIVSLVDRISMIASSERNDIMLQFLNPDNMCNEISYLTEQREIDKKAPIAVSHDLITIGRVRSIQNSGNLQDLLELHAQTAYKALNVMLRNNCIIRNKYMAIACLDIVGFDNETKTPVNKNGYEAIISSERKMPLGWQTQDYSIRNMMIISLYPSRSVVLGLKDNSRQGVIDAFNELFEANDVYAAAIPEGELAPDHWSEDQI